MRSASLIAAILTIAIAAPAMAQDKRLEAAREEAGSLPTPIAQMQTPAGRLGLERAELLAARHDQPIRFVLTLDRAVERGTVAIALPRRWRDVPSSGLRPSTPPRGRRVGRADDVAELVLDGSAAGETITAEVRDRGIPAGTYELPVTYSEDGGPARRIGRLELVLYAPVREQDRPWSAVRALNVSDSPFDQSETFVSVVPGNPQRLIAGANGGADGFSAWISDDGGDTWVERPVPTASSRVSGTTVLQTCCDPISAADADGNLWYGGVDDLPDSHIVVARVPAGANDFVNTVALPSRDPSGVQDKPMMTIDNSPSSPTFGRLYVVWSEPARAGTRIVTSFCDTRPGGVADVARCDVAASWSAVTPITAGTGSYIYADVAVGPDGKVFVIWWNYSAANRIEGSVCAANCGAAGSWPAPAGIAPLDATGATPLPFDCPIVAQPGGRASTGANVEVARADGRVYVAWSDLRPGSGTTRCAEGATPLASHLRFDPLVKSAAGALPTAATPATRLLSDAEGAVASDDWFPWLAVDQSTGLAYAAFYSTREDSTRRTAHYYARSVGAGLGSLGPLVRVSDAASDYSGAPCCTFGNDYGDYAGLDVTEGLAYAIWSDRSTSSGEALAEALTLPAPGEAALLRPGAPAVDDASPGGDGDGVPEPGETLGVRIPVTNDGTATATAATGTLSTTSAKASLSRASATYGDVAAGATAAADPYAVAVAGDLGCGATVPLRLRVAHADGFAVERYAVQTGGAPVAVASADVPKTIPATEPAAVSSTIVMPESGRIGDIDVGLSIAHTFVGDLSLVLRHPDGTEVELTHRAGDASYSADDYTGTIFDDEAALGVFAAAAPFTGRVRPEDPLSALDGKPWAGTWTLTVVDALAPDGGELTGWSLQRRTCGEAVPDAPQPGDPPASPAPRQTEEPPPTLTPPTSPPFGPAEPFVALTRPGANVRVRRGRFRVGIRGCAACRGQITLTTQRRVRLRRGASARRVRVARASFTIGAGGTARVNVRLTRPVVALLRRLRRIPLSVALSATSADGRSARAGGRVTLRR